MKVKVWGARGSVPSPGPETNRYGGNTSCVQVTADDGTTIVLDGGTGIRNLGMATGRRRAAAHPAHPPAPRPHPGADVLRPAVPARVGDHDLGPASPEAPLMDRIARYISAPLAPVEVRELPCHLAFKEAEPTEWEIEGMQVRADSVTHRGPTLGYRVESGDQSVCYIPDHEPDSGPDLRHRGRLDLGLRPGPGREPSAARLPVHRRGAQGPPGLGPPALTDAVEFGRRTRVGRVRAVPPRPPAYRRVPGRLRCPGSRAVRGAGRRSGPVGAGSRTVRDRGGAARRASSPRGALGRGDHPGRDGYRLLVGQPAFARQRAPSGERRRVRGRSGHPLALPPAFRAPAHDRRHKMLECCVIAPTGVATAGTSSTSRKMLTNICSSLPYQA